jgi:hypothetical protein
MSENIARVVLEEDQLNGEVYKKGVRRSTKNIIQ